MCDFSHPLSSEPVDSSLGRIIWFITGHSIRLVLRDFQFGHLGQVCTLSRQDIDGLAIVPIRPITGRHSLFAHSSTPWGVALHSRSAYCSSFKQTPLGLPCFADNPIIRCLGAPTPAVALGTANQQNGSANSGYLPFGSSVS